MESNKLHGYDIITFGTSYDRTKRCIVNSTRATETIARKLAAEFCKTKGGQNEQLPSSRGVHLQHLAA